MYIASKNLYTVTKYNKNKVSAGALLNLVVIIKVFFQSSFD